MTSGPDAGAGSVLRARRLAAGLTIDELARRSGLSPRTLGGIERGTVRRPHPATLAAISAALGLDPPAAQRLHEAVRTPEAPDGAGSLPRVWPHLAGRRAELERLGRAGGAVLLHGLPGVGTTSVAVRAANGLADRFPDGARFLPVGAATPAALAGRVLGELGPARSALRQLRIVLVLDGVRSREQLAALLPPDGPGLVLATAARAFAELPGLEQRVLAPLAPDDAAHALAGMLPDAPAALVERLAGVCGGLPLALRTAANRVLTRPQWSTGRVIDRLDRGRLLDGLVAGDRSVEAALRAGYDGLPAGARAALRALPAQAGRLDGPELAPLRRHGWLTPSGGGYAVERVLLEFAATLA